MLRNNHGTVCGFLEDVLVWAGTFESKNQHSPRSLETTRGRTLEIGLLLLSDGGIKMFSCATNHPQSEGLIALWCYRSLAFIKGTRIWDGHWGTKGD